VESPGAPTSRGDGGPPLANAAIQAELLAEAIRSANVGFLVWDDERRYIAANAVACEILGTTLADLLGQPVGAHTEAGEARIEEAFAAGFVYGVATVNRFDGSGQVDVFYATFTTKTAGLPYMATLIAARR
jgi:PAS domain-containing protein